MTVTLIFVRFVHEASLMALFGSACLLALLGAKVPELALEGGGLRFGRRLMALAALLSAPAWLVLSVPGGYEALQRSAGTNLAVQLFLPRLLLLLALAVAVWRGRTRPAAWLSGAALVLIAVTSHAAAASLYDHGLIGSASDGLHLLTGGYWIGSLCVLAALLVQRPQAPRLYLAVTVFAEWGIIAVVLLVMTGMINAAMVLLGTPGHDSPAYLAMLGLKLVLVAAMITLALINHIRLLRLARDGATANMKIHTRWELGLGASVVGLAVTLASLPPTFQ